MGYDAKLNRQKFQSLIGQKNWTAKEFHTRWKKNYGFAMRYNNFMELVNNNLNWKLLYAFAIADMLEVSIDELFYFGTEETGNVVI
jgi:hypothetical protein